VLLLFQRNDITGFFLLVFFAFALRFPYFFLHVPIEDLGLFYSGGMFPFDFLKNWYASYPLLYMFVSTVIWIFFAIYIKSIVLQEKLLQGKDFVAGMSVLLISSALPQLSIFSTHMLSAMLIFWAFARIISTQYNLKAQAHYFYIGFILGFAVIVHWTAIIFFPAAIWILLRIRLFVVRELAALVAGFVLPLYLMVGLQYVVSGKIEILTLFQAKVILPAAIQSAPAVLTLGLLIVLGSLVGISLYPRNKLENRMSLNRKWNAIILYAVFGLILSTQSLTWPGVPLVYFLAPFGIILGSAFSNNKRKYNTFTFYLAVLTVLSIQWVIRLV